MLAHLYVAMYFSHERSSPIQIRERDWKAANEETDMFEMEQFAHSQKIFQENTQKERLKEEMYFQNIRNNLSASEDSNGLYDDSSHELDRNGASRNHIENYHDDHTHAEPNANGCGETTGKSYMDIYNEEKQQKERDDMERHLRIVREKIRLRRLEQESNSLKIMHQHGDKSSNEYVDLSVLKAAVEQQQNIVSQYEHEQVQQKQEENSYTSLEQLLPKREVDPREELFNRRPEKWKDANNNGQQQSNRIVHSQRVRRRQMATNADFGGGLGDCMIQREQSTTNHNASSNLGHNTYQARRRRGRPMATISDFGGSLSDVMSSSNRRIKRLATDHGNSQTYQRQAGNEMTRTNLQQRRERESMQNWGSGSLSDVLVQPTRATMATPNPSTSHAQNISENNVVRQQRHGSGNDVWAGQSLGDVLPQRRSVQRTLGNPPSNAVNRSERERSQASSRLNSTAETASIWQGQSLGDVMPTRSSSGRNNTRNRGGNSTETRRNGVMDSQHLSSGSASSTFAGNSGDYMADNAMTYERLLALDEAVPNRRLQMAKKNKLNPEDLYKKLRTGFYRNKSNEKEADECAICLDSFKHHAPTKIFPCSHIFHAECAKELLKYDTRCALCRYDVAAGGHT